LQHLTIPQWTTRVTNAEDPLVAAADSNANITLALILFATLISVLGIVLTVYNVFSHLELTAIKSDFVSRATHELKTPLSGISLVADTLVKKRRVSDESLVQYGTVLQRETRRLTALVDSLLLFSRITSSPRPYDMSPLSIAEPVAEALEMFKAQVEDKA